MFRIAHRYLLLLVGLLLRGSMDSTDPLLNRPTRLIGLKIWMVLENHPYRLSVAVERCCMAFGIWHLA